MNVQRPICKVLTNKMVFLVKSFSFILKLKTYEQLFKIIQPMQVKQFLSVAGAITFLYGFALLMLPETVAEAHRVTNLSTFNIFNLRLLGSALVAAGVMYWMAMPARLSYGRRAVLVFMLLSEASVAILSLLEVFTNGESYMMRWVDIGLSTIFAIGAAYFLTKEKDLKF